MCSRGVEWISLVEVEEEVGVGNINCFDSYCFLSFVILNRSFSETIQLFSSPNTMS